MKARLVTSRKAPHICDYCGKSIEEGEEFAQLWPDGHRWELHLRCLGPMNIFPEDLRFRDPDRFQRHLATWIVNGHPIVTWAWEV